MLFTPFKLGNTTFKNRIVRSATNDHLAEPDGNIGPEVRELYTTLAKNEIGLIITGHLAVSEKYKAAYNQPLMTEYRFAEPWQKISAIVHSYGAAIWGQISHGGAKAYYGKFDYNTASKEEIDELPGLFAKAALCVKKAGMDGVQLHLAHGYLFSDVLDGTVNKRTDEYGGSPENRFSIVRRTIRAVREVCGEKFPVAVKLNANDLSFGDYDETLLYYAKELKACGVCAIELSGMDFIKRKKGETAYYLREALLIKEATGMPILLVGGMDDRDAAEDALAKGIDMVSIARPFICEPDYVLKLKAGQKTSKCLRCNQCFRLFNTKFKNCVFLPEDPKLREIWENVK